MPKVTLWAAEWIIAALRASWIVLVLLAFVALILGMRAWRSVLDPDDRAKARAAVRTSRFALAIPCLSFLLITNLLWASLFSLARKVQDPFLQTDKMETAGLTSQSGKNNTLRPPGGAWFPEFLVPAPNKHMEGLEEKICSSGASCENARIQWEDSGGTIKCSPNTDCQAQRIGIKFFDPPHKDYLKEVLAWSVTPGFLFTLILAAAGLLLMVWWALPSVLTEKFPLRKSSSRNQKKKPKHCRENPPRSSTNAASVRLGSWISRGLDGTSLVVLLVWCAIFVAPLYFLYRYPSGLLPHLRLITGRMVYYLVEVTAGVGILAIIVKYSSPVLGIVLDVDNYLRTSPVDATPRAKIAERYVSLLRYLARYRDPVDGRGYDSVVIVSHSLGTLISADLLRFLYSEGDPALAPLGLAGENERKPGRISLKLLTMGSPNRQLLNRFFPYLYDWVRENPDNGTRSLPAPLVSPPTIPPDALPDPAELGLTTWVNMYRSGDYVGRSLWLTEWYRRTAGADDAGGYPESLYVANSGTRSEMCIGAGAHTHYWDDTAPEVAEQLNALL